METMCANILFTYYRHYEAYIVCGDIDDLQLNDQFGCRCFQKFQLRFTIHHTEEHNTTLLGS